MTGIAAIIKLFDKIKWKIGHYNRLDSNILNYVFYGLIFDVMVNTYKPFALKFLERVGGDDFYISLYNSLPGLVAIFAILPGALFFSRFLNKKKVSAIVMAVSRLFLLGFVFVPFFPDGLKPLMFVLILSMMNFPEAIFQTLFSDLLGDVLSPKVRVGAIALRNKFGYVVVLAVTLITGIIIRTVPKTSEQTIFIYQIFFIIAFIAGVVELIMLLRFKVAKRETNETKRPGAKITSIADVFKNKQFMTYILAITPFYFSWVLGWPAVGVYQIINLGADEIWLAIFSVVSCVSSFFSAGVWNYIIRRKGLHMTLVYAMMALAMNMLVYPFSPNLNLMIVASVISGFSVMGINITLFNVVLGASPNENRVVYMGVYHTMVNIISGVTPFVSLILMRTFGVQFAMYIVGMCRMTGCGVLLATVVHLKKNNALESI